MVLLVAVGTALDADEGVVDSLVPKAVWQHQPLGYLAIERKGSHASRQGCSVRKEVVEAAASMDFCVVVGASRAVDDDAGVEGRIRLVSATVKNEFVVVGSAVVVVADAVDDVLPHQFDLDIP